MATMTTERTAPIYSAGEAKVPQKVAGDQWAVLAGLRFVLACIVMVCHLRVASTVGFLDATLGSFGCVMGFFAISGYSIAHSISRAASIRKFYERRALRIWPLAVAATLLTIAVVAVRGPAFSAVSGEYFEMPSLGQFLGNLFLLQGIACSVTLLDAPLWSLSLEAVYYLFAPILHRLRLSTLMLFIAISCVAFCVHVLCGQNSFVTESHAVGVVCLAWAWLAGFIYQQYSTHRWAIAFLILPGALMLTILNLSAPSSSFFIFVATALTIASATTIRLPESWPLALNYMGELSYPLYVSHVPVFFILGALALPAVLAAPVCILCALIVAMALYHFIDVPIRKYKQS